MRLILTFVLVANAVAAQTAADTTSAIRDTLKRFNEARAGGLESMLKHLTRGADFRSAAGEIRKLAAVVADRPVWTEHTPPRIEQESMRMLSSDSAIVEGFQVEYGSVPFVRKQPVMVYMRKESGVWKIAGIRMLAGSSHAEQVNIRR